jgi:hypothetical protein
VSFLLDTNVISEWVKPRPSANVVAWLSDADEDGLFVSVIAFAEIGRGIALLPPGPQRNRLTAWLEADLTERFEARVIPIDPRVAQAWGALMAKAQRAGLTLGAMDGFIAATAAEFDLTLVTRNIRDFQGLGIKLVDPWSSA